LKHLNARLEHLNEHLQGVTEHDNASDFITKGKCYINTPLICKFTS